MKFKEIITMDTKPLDGYVRLLTTTISMLLTIILLFVTDPAKADSITQFVNALLIPAIPQIANIIFVIVRTITDGQKITAKKDLILAGVLPAAGSGSTPPQLPAPRLNPAALATAPAAPPYVPFDIGAAIGAAEEQCRKDGVEVNPISRAFYFYPMVTRFDLREVPRTERVSEAKRLVDKAVDLFCEAFKHQTKLPKPPTQVEAASYHTYMAKLKKDYEKANGLTCSDTTFEQLRNLISYFNEIYAAQDGLAQLVGKTVDFSIYGSGAYTPTQVGWDYVKLL
jgi:hypothetical protein